MYTYIYIYIYIYINVYVYVYMNILMLNVGTCRVSSGLACLYINNKFKIVRPLFQNVFI